MNQAEARYRRGTPINHCGICIYYQGGHRCSKVEGDITPYGISDVFMAEKNPFGSTLAPNEKKMIEVFAADAQDRSQGPAMGSLAQGAV